jgi:RimJ/RimL family protein N-acetyltransferase
MLASVPFMVFDLHPSPNDKGLRPFRSLGQGGRMEFPRDVPVLTDGVVTLRAHRETDVPELLEQALDPLMVEWTTVPVPSSEDSAREFATTIVPLAWVRGSAWSFAVEAEDDGGTRRFCGTVELRPEGARRAEIAYGAHPWARGRGLMERACRVLLDWGFGERRLESVIWWAHKGNWASRRLAWRLGFSFDGTVRRWLEQRGALRDAWVGGLTVSDRRAPRHAWFDVPTLTGSSVVLRGHRDADAGRVQQACSDARTQHWLEGLPSPYTIRDAREYLESRREQCATGSGLSWAVADGGSGLLLGTISVFDLKPGYEAEIGYWTHPDARGRGVMTQSCGLVVRHAFVPEEDGGLGLRRLTVYAGEQNAASRRVIEANGFVVNGRERNGTRMRDGSLMDTVCHDLLVEEWLGRHRD